MPGGRAHAPTSLAVKVGATMMALIVVLTCLAVANGARKRTQRNTSMRLELTRKRFDACDVERRMLSGEKLSGAHAVQLAQEEYDALKLENDLLKEDNAALNTDVAELERTVDNLREELDDKDFISDDEAQALEETLALGNNSKALADLLEGASFSDETDIVVGKDELITLLLSELKLKRTSLATCMARKKVVGKFEGQILWGEMTDQQKSASLRAQVKKIALLQQSNPEEAEALLQRWAPRHYRGEPGLREDVSRRLETKATRERKHGAPRDEDDEGEDEADAGWNEWDWDAEDAN